MSTPTACRVCGNPIPALQPGTPGRRPTTCSAECRLQFDRQRYHAKNQDHAREVSDLRATIDALRLRVAMLEGELLRGTTPPPSQEGSE